MPVCPECAQGKHGNCDNKAGISDDDTFIPCMCFGNHHYLPYLRTDLEIEKESKMSVYVTKPLEVQAWLISDLLEASKAFQEIPEEVNGLFITGSLVFKHEPAGIILFGSEHAPSNYLVFKPLDNTWSVISPDELDKTYELKTDEEAEEDETETEEAPIVEAEAETEKENTGEPEKTVVQEFHQRLQEEKIEEQERPKPSFPGLQAPRPAVPSPPPVRPDSGNSGSGPDQVNGHP